VVIYKGIVPGGLPSSPAGAASCLYRSRPLFLYVYCPLGIVKLALKGRSLQNGPKLFSLIFRASSVPVREWSPEKRKVFTLHLILRAQ